MFAGIDAIQGDLPSVNLVEKVQAVMVAVTASKRKCEDREESEGELVHSRQSIAICKVGKM